MRILYIGTAAALAFIGFTAGELRGQSDAPIDSELATAQELSGDRDVRWIGYGCGDDGATIVTRDMPGADCKESRRLNDSDYFPAPPERR
jgi:hypothetical protein